jgi:hypothetical protein
MATSGTKTFDPNSTEIAEEAYERIGTELRTGYNIETARRSMNFLLAEWANEGINLWTVAENSITLTESDATETLSASLIDITSAVLRRDSTDIAIERVSREEWLNIPNKSEESRPTQWYLDRQVTPILNLWPTPENSTDIFKYFGTFRLDDVTGPLQNIQIPFRFLEAFTAGLAARLCIKASVNSQEMMMRIPILSADYELKLRMAKEEDRDKSSFIVRPDLSGYSV